MSSKIVGASKRSLTFGKHTKIRFRFAWAGGGRRTVVASSIFCSVPAFLLLSKIVVVSIRRFPVGRPRTRSLRSEWCRGWCRPLKALNSHLYGITMETVDMIAVQKYKASLLFCRFGVVWRYWGEFPLAIIQIIHKPILPVEGVRGWVGSWVITWVLW